MSSSRIGGTRLVPSTHPSNQVGGKLYTPAAHYPSSAGSTAVGLPQGMAYTVCEVSDGSTSCDCMGWTRRNPPGGRTCKHTQDYELTLRADWNVPQVTIAPEPVVQAGVREKGGSLTDLFAKLSKEN
ncbi:hypothetical protein LCGC14_2247480 [marine sediment metagenome]|uniref:SWIM-type domain-containing protein n=1 Tax=marine sediment metagenome TaxID=412755 RepID=A0A0F9DR17_9ZZZZ